jgi:hypothetical protein
MDRAGPRFLRGREPRLSPALPVSYGLGEHLSAKLMAIAPVASELAT